MTTIQSERDFCLVLLGLLAAKNLTEALASEALSWWQNAAGPRGGWEPEFGRLLARVSGRKLPAGEAMPLLERAALERLQELAPDTMLTVVREKFAAIASRVGGPVLDSDLRDLDRIQRLMQLRKYLEPVDDAAAAHGALQSVARELAQTIEERNTLVCLIAHFVIRNGGQAGWWQDPAPGSQAFVGFELPSTDASASSQVAFPMDERDPRRPWETLPLYSRDEAYPASGHEWGRISDFLHTAKERLAPALAKPDLEQRSGRGVRATRLDETPAGELDQGAGEGSPDTPAAPSAESDPPAEAPVGELDQGAGAGAVSAATPAEAPMGELDQGAGAGSSAATPAT